MIPPPTTAGARRSGYVLADALAGLAILAAGLATFLGCMSQGHRLMTRARETHEVRVEAAWQLARAADRRGAGPFSVRVDPIPGPAQLARAGAALCVFTVGRATGSRLQDQVRTIRFCPPSGEPSQ